MKRHLAACGAVFALAMPGAAAAQTESRQAPAARTADAYFQFILGRHLESEGEVDRAVEAFREAARLDPSSAEVRAELAGLYARQGRLDDAIAEARGALAIDDDNHEAHRVLGTLYASVIEETASPDKRESQLNAAIEHLERARRPDGFSPDPSVALMLSRLYMQVEQPDRAVATLRQLVQDHPVLEAWLLLGQAYTAAGQPEEAARALEEGAALDPRLLFGLAEMYERQEQWAEAAGAYERAASLGSPTADLRTRWAGALLNVPGEDAARQALGLLEVVVRDDPSDDRALYMIAQAHRRLRAFDAAEAAARRVMALRPESLWGPYALAQVFEDRREYRRVVETLSAALEQWKPSRGAPAQHGVTLLTHLGFAQLQLGRGDDAAATFARAKSLAEGSPSVDVYLAQALVVAKRFDEALRLLTPLRERQPNDYRLAQVAVRALTGLGREDEAVDVLRSAVAASPGEPPPYLALADLLSEQKREGEAHDVLDDAARRFPKDPSVPFQRGALYERSGEMAQAEAAFRDVLTLDPNHAPALNYLGYMLAERGVRLDEALTLIERALSVDPDNGAYLDSLGWTYYQMKQFDRAKVHLARAAEQLPSNSVVQDHLGDVLAALGRREEAIVAWQRALEGDRESVEVAAIQSKIRRARSQAER